MDGYSPAERSLSAISVFDRPSYLYVAPILCLYFLALFGIFPLTVQIQIERICEDKGEDDCDGTEVTSEASLLNLVALTCMNITAIFTCGIYGAMADKYGRKVVILISLTGMLCLVIAYLIVDIFHPKFYAVIIIIGATLAGLCGSYITVIMSCLCYASDATMDATHERKGAYSVLEASIFAPQIIGPVLSGVWASYFDFTIPIAAAAGLLVVAILYLLVLPESLPPSAPSRILPLRLDLFQTFRNIKFLLWYTQSETDELTGGGIDDNSRSAVPWVGSAFLWFFIALMGSSAAQVVYVKHVFGWDSLLIGMFDGFNGLSVTLSMLFAPKLVDWIFGSDHKPRVITWIQIGYTFRALFWALFGIMPNTGAIFCLLPILLLTGPIAPYSRTILSNSVPPEQQARIFSAFSAIEGLGALLGPLYNAIYAVAVSIGAPWLIFEIMAAMAVLALSMIWYVRASSKLNASLPADEKVEKFLRGSGDGGRKISSVDAVLGIAGAAGGGGEGGERRGIVYEPLLGAADGAEEEYFSNDR